MGVTSTGQNKVAYLGSLRGFATLAVTLGHWITMYMNLPLYADLAWDPNTAVHYPRWMIYGWKMSLSLILGGAASFRVAMFFVLPARILGLRYLSRGGLLNLADSSIRRLPRIIFPVFLAALLEYFLIEVSTFRWISRLPSRTWNTWSYFENYGNLFEFFNSFVSLWFVSPPIQPAIVQRYAIGIMWTVPLMIQLTWSLFLCAIIARQIKSHWKRWSFYSACLFFNWYANRFDTLFIMGLTVADLDCNLNYRKRAKNGVPLFPSLLTKRYPSLQRIRLPGQVFAWIIFFTGFGMAWCEVSGKGPHLAPIKELALRPDFYTGNPRGWNNPHLSLAYNDLKFTCILPVLSFYLLCDLNETFAKAFSLKIWEIIGRHSFGVFLLHGAVFWSWGPFCLIQLLSAGLPYWSAHLIAFITSYSLLAVVAVIFTHTADTWGAWVSVALWRTVSRGYARRPGK
jgi:peptidoglycan/LPS O-acetylase OafA/YrhL